MTIYPNFFFLLYKIRNQYLKNILKKFEISNMLYFKLFKYELGLLYLRHVKLLNRNVLFDFKNSYELFNG